MVALPRLSDKSNKRLSEVTGPIVFLMTAKQTRKLAFKKAIIAIVISKIHSISQLVFCNFLILILKIYAWNSVQVKFLFKCKTRCIKMPT